MSLADVLGRIPYLRVHRLEVSEDAEGAITAQMPLSEEISNHVGIVHAGALFTAAETAAGVAAWRVVPEGRAFVLLRGAEVRYTRRAEGDVVAAARIGTHEANRARALFAESGRGDVRAEVVATGPDGQEVFEGVFDYALRPARSQP